jgi:hypothetical protein
LHPGCIPYLHSPCSPRLRPSRTCRRRGPGWLARRCLGCCSMRRNDREEGSATHVLQCGCAAADWLKPATTHLYTSCIASHLAPLSSCLNARPVPSAIGSKADMIRRDTTRSQERLKPAVSAIEACSAPAMGKRWPADSGSLVFRPRREEGGGRAL